MVHIVVATETIRLPDLNPAVGYRLTQFVENATDDGNDLSLGLIRSPFDCGEIVIQVKREFHRIK